MVEHGVDYERLGSDSPLLSSTLSPRLSPSTLEELCSATRWTPENSPRGLRLPSTPEELFSATPQSWTPETSPRRAATLPALRPAEAKSDSESVDSSNEDDYASRMHKREVPPVPPGGIEGLREFAKTLHRRKVLSVDEYESSQRLRRQIIIRSAATGEEHDIIKRITDISTYADFFMEAQKVLEKEWHVWVRLFFISAACGYGGKFSENEELQCTKKLCAKEVRGCIFLAVCMEYM